MHKAKQYIPTSLITRKDARPGTGVERAGPAVSYRMNAAARKHGAAPPEASFVSVKYSGGRSLSFSDNKRDLCFTGDSGHIARDKPRLLLWVQGSAV